MTRTLSRHVESDSLPRIQTPEGDSLGYYDILTIEEFVENLGSIDSAQLFYVARLRLAFALFQLFIAQPARSSRASLSRGRKLHIHTLQLVGDALRFLRRPGPAWARAIADTHVPLTPERLRTAFSAHSSIESVLL